MTRRPRVLALLLAALLLLTGCGEMLESGEEEAGQESEPEVTVAATPAFAWSGADVFDPLTVTSAYDLALTPLLYEGLYRLQDDLTATPVLCQSVSISGDGLTWTLTVKSGVTFHSGVALTAADVADSLNRARENPDSPYYQRLQGIRSVEGEGMTVTIRLTQPNARLDRLLDVPVCRAKSAGFYDGTGPYRPDPEDAERLLAFSGWHGGALAFDHVLLQEAADADVAYYRFETGDVNLALSPALTAAGHSFTGNVQLLSQSTTTLHYLGVNCRSGVLSSPQARRALSLMLDRQAVCDGALQGHAAAVWDPVPPARQGEAPAESEEGEIETLLAAAGLADGNADGIWQRGEYVGSSNWTPEILVCQDNPYKVAAAQQIQQQLQEQGVAATVVQVDEETFLQRVERGDFDLYYGQVTLTADWDLSPLLTGALNYGGFSSADTAAALTQVQAGGDAGESALIALFDQQAPLLLLGVQVDETVLGRQAIANLTPLPHQPYGDAAQWRQEEET